MGRFVFVFALLVGAAMLAANGVSISSLSSLDLRGVGTRIEGRRVVLESGQLEAHFSKAGSIEESYMLFGGDLQEHRNSIMHATIAGLATQHARFIAARHPDFYMCKSPGAKPAQQLTETMALVAGDRAALSALDEAATLFHERVRAGGERTCIHLRGAPLVLESVRIEDGEVSQDISHEVVPKFVAMNFVLAESVELEDCKTLLR